MKTLFEVNPRAELQSAAARFARTGRAQVRDFLTPESANEIRDVLTTQTPWGLSVQAGERGAPHQVRAEALSDPSTRQQMGESAQKAAAAAASGEFAFFHARYSLVEAYLGKWRPDGPHDVLLEYRVPLKSHYKFPKLSLLITRYYVESNKPRQTLNRRKIIQFAKPLNLRLYEFLSMDFLIQPLQP